MGCSFSGRRNPAARARTLSNDTRGRKGTYLKLGSRYTDVVCSSARWRGTDEGKDAFRIDTLWKG
jgi:hypothetical protein